MAGKIDSNEKHKVPKGHARSDQWPKVRKAWLKLHPNCAVCDGTKEVEVHHKLPFHLDKAKELDPTNLITLCENKRDGVNCHLFVGHLGNFKSYNASVELDAHQWAGKIQERPKG